MISSQKSLNIKSNNINNTQKACKDRFKKYKSIIQTASKQDKIDKLQHIFSHVSYNHIDIQGYLTDSCCSIQERLSTKQQSLEQSTEQTSFDTCQSYLFSSIILQSFISLKQSPTFSINSQKPTYIQQLNRLNSITPNFNHPSFNIKDQMKNINKLIKITLQAINHVFSCALRIGYKDKKIKVFSCSNVNKLTLKFFMSSGWEKVRYDSKIQAIRPAENFKGVLDFNQILYQLDLMLSTMTRYELTTSLLQQIDQQIYKSIRQCICEIENKLIQCSNSLYTIWNTYQYPNFYYKYLQILRNQRMLSKQEIKIFMSQFRELWDLHEPVTCSEIGREVWNRLNFNNYQQQQNNSDGENNQDNLE